MRIIPFVWPALSGADAVKDFRNGNIKSGLWNVGWCVGWLALDIFTWGTVSTGLRAAKIAGNVAVHTGIMFAWQGIQEYFENARTDKIDIEKL
jgi:hypothetical protein